MHFFVKKPYFLLLLLLPVFGHAQKKKKRKNKKGDVENTTLPKTQERTHPSDNELKAEYIFIKAEGRYLLHDYNAALKLFMDAASLSPNNDAVYYKISQCHQALENYDKAKDNIQKAIKLEPSNREYYLALADIYSVQKDLINAALTYEALIENVEQSNSYHLEAADAYQRLAQLEVSKKTYYAKDTENKSSEKKLKEAEKALLVYQLKAVDHLQSFQTIFGKNPEISREIEKLYLGVNMSDEAINEAQSMADYYPKKPEYQFHVIELMITNGKYDEGITKLIQLTEEHPNNFQYSIALASYYQQNGELQKSHEVLRKTFSNPDLSVDNKVKLISTYLDNYNDEKGKIAEELCLLTIDNHQDKAQAYSIYGDVLYLQNRKIEARDQYYQAVQLDSSVYLIWQQIVIIDAEIEDNKKLVEHCDEALALFPDKPILWFYKGLGHQILKNDSMAILAYENGLPHARNNPNLLEQYYAQLGDSYHNLNSKQKAYNSYEEALSINPNNIHVLNNYSYFLSLDKEKLEKAKSMSKKTILLHPDEATYLDTYAWILYQLGDYSNAKIYLEKALTNSQDGTILEHYGDVLYQLNEVDKAISNWKQAKENGGGSPLLDKKIRDGKLYE